MNICVVKPAHVAETEEEIHITLAIPNRREESRLQSKKASTCFKQNLSPKKGKI